MQITFNTRQFQAGNSQAVRLPAAFAFPPKTELMVTRENGKIIVQPRAQTMEGAPKLFAALKPHLLQTEFQRPAFIEAKRSTKATNKNTQKRA